MRINAGIVAAVVFSSCCVWLSAFSQSVPPEDPDSVFVRALRLQRAGKLDVAKQEFLLLLRRFPEYHDARVQYGFLLAWEERYQAALLQFDSVLFVQPSHVEARFGKSQTLAWLGRYRQSVDIILALIQEYPQSVRFLSEAGHVYLRGGAPRKALEYYEKAYIRLPNDKDVMRDLARVHRTLGNKDLALYWYRKLLAASPGNDEARAEVLRLTYEADHEIQLTSAYESFTTEGIRQHTLLQAEYFYALDKNWKPFLHFSIVSKFSERESRFGGGFYAILTNSMSSFVQIIVSPNANVVPSLDVTAELNAGIVRSVDLIGGFRVLQFDSVNVSILMPGLTWYIEDEVWITTRGYFGLIPNQTTSSTAAITLSFRPTPLTTMRIGGFSGNEILRATTIGELSSIRSSGAFLEIKSRLDPHFSIDAQYLYTNRNSPSHSHLMTVTVSVLF
ncbi:MAG: YaiO family outer membrane beta-barrel protein [Bacteroidota bacterium]